MAAGSGDIQGLDRLVETLKSAAHDLAGLDGAHRQAGQVLQATAEQRAPRQTGLLASRHETVVTAGHVAVTNTAAYAGYVHAQDPWLLNSFNALTGDLIDIYSTETAEIVSHITGR